MWLHTCVWLSRRLRVVHSGTRGRANDHFRFALALAKQSRRRGKARLPRPFRGSVVRI